MPIDSQRRLPKGWLLSGWTYTEVTSAGEQSVTFADPGVAYYPHKRAQAAPSNGVYLQTDSMVTFATYALDELGTNYEPQPRHKITPPGKRAHVVLDCVLAPQLMFWKCTIRDLVIAHALCDTCDIVRYTVAPGADARRVPGTETLLVSAQDCRVQPVTMISEPDTDGGFTTRETYTLFIATEVELLAGDVVKVGANTYRVTSQSNRDMFDTLVSASVERVV